MGKRSEIKISVQVVKEEKLCRGQQDLTLKGETMPNSNEFVNIQTFKEMSERNATHAIG
jgi:hypothetical protein